MDNEMRAKEGYVFAAADKSAVFGAVMYLGIHDKPENYIEITIEEAEALAKEIEAKEKEQIANETK